MEPSQSLYETPADELDTFVRQSLQPQKAWKEEVQDAWERSERFLRDVCFHDELIEDQTIRVLKVVKVSTWETLGVRIPALLLWDCVTWGDGSFHLSQSLPPPL